MELTGSRQSANLKESWKREAQLRIQRRISAKGQLSGTHVAEPWPQIRQAAETTTGGKSVRSKNVFNNPRNGKVDRTRLVNHTAMFVMEHTSAQLKDIYVIDSGCESSVVYDKSRVINLQPTNVNLNSAQAGTKLKITQKGVMQALVKSDKGPHPFQCEVLYGHVGVNLLSEAALHKIGYRLRCTGEYDKPELVHQHSGAVLSLFRHRGTLPALVLSKESDIFTGSAQTTPSVPIGAGEAHSDNPTSSPPPPVVYATTLPLNAKHRLAIMWHRKLGHAGQEAVARTLASHLPEEAKACDHKGLPFCLSCAQGKAHRLPLGTHHSDGEYVARLPVSKMPRGIPLRENDVHYSDILGPFSVPGLTGHKDEAKMVLGVFDKRTGAAMLYPMTTKRQILTGLQRFRTECGGIRVLRTDNEAAFRDAKIAAWAVENKIILQNSTPYTPEQNGVAERGWRTHCNRATCMLHDSGLPRRFWWLAIRLACLIHNRLAAQGHDWKSPLQVMTGKLGAIQHLHPFGCRAVMLEEHKEFKLDPKGKEGFYMGFLGPSHLIWVPQKDANGLVPDIEKGTLYETRNVSWDENNSWATLKSKMSSATQAVAPPEEGEAFQEELTAWAKQHPGPGGEQETTGQTTAATSAAPVGVLGTPTDSSTAYDLEPQGATGSPRQEDFRRRRGTDREATPAASRRVRFTPHRTPTPEQPTRRASPAAGSANQTGGTGAQPSSAAAHSGWTGDRPPAAPRKGRGPTIGARLRAAETETAARELPGPSRPAPDSRSSSPAPTRNLGKVMNDAAPAMTSVGKRSGGRPVGRPPGSKNKAHWGLTSPVLSNDGADGALDDGRARISYENREGPTVVAGTAGELPTAELPAKRSRTQNHFPDMVASGYIRSFDGAWHNGEAVTQQTPVPPPNIVPNGVVAVHADPPSRGPGEEREESQQALCLTEITRLCFGVTYANPDNPNRKFSKKTMQRLLEADPKTVPEAMLRSDWPLWAAALNSEHQSLKEHEVWVMVKEQDIPAHATVLDSLYVLKTKYNPDWTIDKYKARLCVKGFGQRAGVDYNETFAPVANFTSLRTMLSLAASHGWQLRQFDVATAFLHAPLGPDESNMYMRFPSGVDTRDKEGNVQVAKLVKSLYGLKQAPRNWYEHFSAFLLSYGFEKAFRDECLFTWHDKKTGALKCVLNVYVDDVPGAVTAEKEWYEVFIKAVEEKFKIKEGSLDYCLGLEIDQRPGEVTVKQTKYLYDVLDRFGMTDCQAKDIPLPTDTKFFKRDGPAVPDPERVHLYRQLIGSLNWLACGTRPDISLAVSLASQVMENPSPEHLMSAMKILNYLKGTPDLGLRYVYGSNQVEGHSQGIQKIDQVAGYSDSDWAGCVETRLSHSGHVFMLNGGPITWMSKKQHSIALSSTEAELVALHHAAAEAIYLRELLSEMDVPQEAPTRLYEDNMACVHLAAHEASLNKTKHIAVKYFFTRQLVKDEVVDVIKCGTDDQLADIFTKILDKTKFQYFRRQLMGD
jgi:hypothetical protein